MVLLSRFNRYVDFAVFFHLRECNSVGLGNIANDERSGEHLTRNVFAKLSHSGFDFAVVRDDDGYAVGDVES